MVYEKYFTSYSQRVTSAEYTEKNHKNIHRKKPYRTIFVTDTVDSRTDKIKIKLF